MIDGTSQKIQQRLGEVGISCNAEQCELLARHLQLVIEKNAVLNLTRIVDTDDAIEKHVVDSLLPLRYMPELAQYDGKAVDIGTGGGFPGLPLAICGVAQWTLVDSVAKKAAAVQEFIQALGLQGRARALGMRSEELARQERGSYGLAVARAVADSAVLIEYSTPLLADDGTLIIYKAKPEPAELEQAARAAEICGLELVSRETFESKSYSRELYIYKRAREAQIQLPRRDGMATKRPLGK